VSRSFKSLICQQATNDLTRNYISGKVKN